MWRECHGCCLSLYRDLCISPNIQIQKTEAEMHCCPSRQLAASDLERKACFKSPCALSSSFPRHAQPRVHLLPTSWASQSAAGLAQFVSLLAFLEDRPHLPVDLRS